MKDSGLGTESRLERSKGDNRQDNIHLEAGNSHISNNNEGGSGSYSCRGSGCCFTDVNFDATAENEETEGSDGPAECMFGDAELDDDDLYSMDHENQAGESVRTSRL